MWAVDPALFVLVTHITACQLGTTEADLNTALTHNTVIVNNSQVVSDLSTAQVRPCHVCHVCQPAHPIETCRLGIPTLVTYCRVCH